MPGRKIATALGPLHHREEANTLRMEPGILLTRGKIDIGFCPAARPQVFFSIKSGAPSQSCKARSWESLIPRRRCSGELTRKRPPKDQNACPPSEASGSCSRRTTRRPASTSSAAATSPARPAPTMITSASSYISCFLFLTRLPVHARSVAP